jgi:HEAT repeat protein
MHLARKLVISAVAPAIFAILLIAISQPSEPKYNGKKLSAWLIEYRQTFRIPTDSPAPCEADVALNNIGTNAIPYLLKWLPYHKTRTQNRIEHLYEKLPTFLARSAVARWVYKDQMDVRSISATLGFRALGEKASIAIPVLLRMANEERPNEDETARRAIQALASLGDDNVIVLAHFLTNSMPSRRRYIAEMLGFDISLGGSPPARVPILLGCLDDADDSVVEVAAETLGRLEVQPEVVVPALELAFRKSTGKARASIVAALGNYGVKAKGTLQLLREALRDPDQEIRGSATNAIARIYPESFSEDLSP